MFGTKILFPYTNDKVKIKSMLAMKGYGFSKREIKRFQRDNSIEESGIIDIETMCCLEETPEA